MIPLLALAVALTSPVVPQSAVLDAFVGRWHLEGTTAPDNAGRRHALTIEQVCSWTPRHAFLSCEQHAPAAADGTAQLTLLWWDPAGRVYRFAGLGMGAGVAVSGTIAIAAPVWTWSSRDGATSYRTLNRFVRPGLIEFRSERSGDGGASWQVGARGTETRLDAGGWNPAAR